MGASTRAHGSAPLHWPLWAFLELDREGRVLGFQGHDPESDDQAALLLGQDLFEVLGRSFDTTDMRERYHRLAARAEDAQFADSYPILIDGLLHGVRIVFSVLPRCGRGSASIRTSGSRELLRMVGGV